LVLAIVPHIVITVPVEVVEAAIVVFTLLLATVVTSDVVHVYDIALVSVNDTTEVEPVTVITPAVLDAV